MNGFLIAGAIIALACLGALVFAAVLILDALRGRRVSGETLWVTASERDPVRAYTLARSVRRLHEGANG